MKILLINKFLYPKGGDAISALALGDLLKSKGHEVIFWGMLDEKDPLYPHRDIFVNKVNFNSSHGIIQQFRMFANVLYSMEAKSKVEKLIQRTGKPDIVHLHNFAHQISPSILHIIKKQNIPCVMTMHDYKMVCPIYALWSNGKPCEECKQGRYYRCLMNKCTKRSFTKSMTSTLEMYLHHSILHVYDLIDVYISPSKFLKSKCEEMGFRRNICYLPNFVNIEAFVPKYEWSENSIVYVGRLTPGKGILTLLEAIKKLSAITLKIIGEGPLNEELCSKIKHLGLRNVSMLGHMSGEVLKDEIRKSMFVVLPSEWYENNPRSVIEAFALGKPVIGARIGGIPELVKDNETGLTFEPENARDLCSKIEYLINSPDKIVKMGKNARLLAEEEFGAEKHYSELISIYQKVVKK